MLLIPPEYQLSGAEAGGGDRYSGTTTTITGGVKSPLAKKIRGPPLGGDSVGAEKDYYN